MNRNPVRRAGLMLLAGALCVAGCRTPERAAVTFESESWSFGKVPGRKLTTAHYTIYTTLDEPVLVEALPGFVEAAYAFYNELVPPAHPLKKRMPVFFFARREEWAAFTRSFTKEKAPLFLQVRYGGYSYQGVSAVQYVRNDVTFPLMSHEGFHQYLHHHVNTRVPSWLNEGLAVCCEGQRWGMRGVKEFDPWFNPKRRNELIEAIQMERLYTVRELLEMHPGSVLQETSSTISTYYAQVWSFVLFLSHGADGQYAEAFQAMLAKLPEVDFEKSARIAHIWSERGTFNLGEALFRRFISEDLDTIEEQYRAFLRTHFLDMSANKEA